MAALADGDMTSDEYDRVGRVIRDRPELGSLEWDWVVHRVQELAEDAPLFFETRQTLPRRLSDPDARRRAIQTAVRIVGAERPLADDERAVLTSLAEAFGIPETEQGTLFLLEPSEQSVEDYGFVRCTFNAPDAPPAKDLVEALNEAEDDLQRRLLLFKLSSARHLAWHWAPQEETVLLKVGERLRFGSEMFRVDALYERTGQRLLTRFLAPTESLHRREHGIMKLLADRLPETACLVVAHAPGLSPEDRSFLAGFDPQRLQCTELWSA